MIGSIMQKKHQVAERKQKSRGHFPKDFDPSSIQKITVFIASMILTVAFPTWKIWLTHTMASLCRRPKMISILQSILHAVNVVSYSWDHEVKKQKERMKNVDPRSKLLRTPETWNVAVIDNIDFKDTTFHHGNIYDVTRNSAHATLRMVFQFQLPFPVTSFLQMNHPQTHSDALFGKSPLISEWEKNIDMIFQQLIENYEGGFDVQDINLKIASRIKIYRLSDSTTKCCHS